MRTGGSTFSLVTSIADGEHRVRPAGDLDAATRPRLEDALRSAERSRPRRLVLDLRALRFMDSSGVHAVVDADRRLRCGRAARLELVAGPEQVQQMFRLTGTEPFLAFV